MTKKEFDSMAFKKGMKFRYKDTMFTEIIQTVCFDSKTIAIDNDKGARISGSYEYFNQIKEK